MPERACEFSSLPFPAHPRAARPVRIIPVHPHMLWHRYGSKLANDGQDTRAIQHYLGHRNIQHTVRYTDSLRPPLQGVLEGLTGGEPMRVGSKHLMAASSHVWECHETN